MADNFSLTKWFRDQYIKEAISRDNSMFVTPTTGIPKPMKYYITDTKKSNAQKETDAMRSSTFTSYNKDGEQSYLKEFTDYGQEGRYPKKEKPGDMFQQKEVEDLFPKGMASRSDKAFQARVKQHADWTEQSGMNNTFVHMQYHETKGLEDEYFIYQTQHYNGNYDDFRNPKFTLLSITKNKDTEKEEDLGEYIVDTNAYIKDLEILRNRGILGDRVMEADLNDPVLVKVRAAKTRKEKMKSVPKLSFDQILDLRDEKGDLERRISNLYREMENDPDIEAEGGPVADQYGDELNKLETRLSQVNKQIKNYDMNEGSCGYTPDGKPRNKPAGPNLMEIKEKVFNSFKK